MGSVVENAMEFTAENVEMVRNNYECYFIYLKR